MISTARPLPQFIRDLLASPPRRGEGLNNWFYRVARVMHPFRTSAEIVEILAAATAGEPVKRGEIERAVERSIVTAWKPGQNSPIQRGTLWPSVNAEQREAVIATANSFGLVDLWEGSPIRFEDNAPHTEEVIDELFPGSPLICCGKNNSDFATHSREDWRGKLTGMQLIVPSPMTARTGRTQDGRVSAHTLENTGARRFLVIEQDLGTVDEQAAILAHLAERAPLVLVVHSGSKSLHGWFYCANLDESLLKKFMCYATSLGADRATWTRCQFVRLPDGTRNNGNRQTVYFFNPEIVR